MPSPNSAKPREPLTALVAIFATRTRYAHIPPDVVRLGKKSILDSLATALSGSVAPASVLIRRYVEGLGVPPGPCTVIGSRLRLPPRFAALANGTAMHADDFDDTLQSVPGGARARRVGGTGLHPTSPVLAAVLAVAEAEGRSGQDLLAAGLVGIEVACKVFDASDAVDVNNGLHTTGTCALVGAAAAVANIADVAVETTPRLLGIACSQAGGLMAQLGTMTKPLHAGRSAESALISKDLAVLGFTASETVLEDPAGFFQLEGGGYKEEPIRRLGNPWSFADRGIWLKPFPTGSLTHPAMTKLLELIRKHDIKPEQVSQVRVATSRNIYNTLSHHQPKRALEAKFSLEFCLATLLLERNLGVAHISDEFVGRPDVQRLIGCVQYVPFSDAQAKTDGYTLVTSFVEIDLKDGRGFKERIDYGKGSKANPLTEEEVAEKFRLCATSARVPKARIEAAIALVRRLDELKDMRELTALLAAAD